MTPPTLGVTIVTFNSAPVIVDCLETLLASTGVRLVVTIVDNASTDGTPDLIRSWAAGEEPGPDQSELPFMYRAPTKPINLAPSVGHASSTKGHVVSLIESDFNGGFAAGVNQGLAALAEDSALDRFWILNPDTLVPPDTAAAFASTGPRSFSLMGGRVLYADRPGEIQIDGGLIDRRTGVTGNVGLGQLHAKTLAADPQELDFITGASMVASREFYEKTGPMKEDYFLYYEEVDWALQRGNLPLAYCAEGIVYHRAGTAIGSPTTTRPASPFSLYFKHRARLLFVRRHFPRRAPTALAYSVAKAAQLRVKGFGAEAAAVMAGSFGRPPPTEIAAHLSPEAMDLIT